MNCDIRVRLDGNDFTAILFGADSVEPISERVGRGRTVVEAVTDVLFETSEDFQPGVRPRSKYHDSVKKLMSTPDAGSLLAALLKAAPIDARDQASPLSDFNYGPKGS